MQVMGTEVKLQIPWIVMTSDATDLPTRTFFEEKHFFGLDKSQVCSPHAECLLSASQHRELVFLLLAEMWQKLKMQCLYTGLPETLDGLFLYLATPTVRS
jgi:hypothetical protein